MQGYASLSLTTLQLGEHLPGWIDPSVFEQLSFFKPDLNYGNIFYGDWMYDTVHFRVTQYRDEFGAIVEEPGAGPQASFMDDFLAAHKAHGNGKSTYTCLKR